VIVTKLNCGFQKLALSGLLLTSALFAGCAAHVRYYDAGHSDYHRFGPTERPYYSRWATENHHDHDDFKRLNSNDQRAYWDWRHNQK
jgi:hypothetical protein